uniref:C2 domain-containing protein n=1 Tax=Davidia involucrata TaxID=16924 RepID=A0A5B6YR64_DAVIN
MGGRSQSRRYKARNVKIIIHSASDLLNLDDYYGNYKMEVYAKVSIKTATESLNRSTPVDRDGHNNPAWHFDMRFTVRESAVEEPGVMLVIKLYCKGRRGRCCGCWKSSKDDVYIGEVSLSLEELFRSRDEKGSGERHLPLARGCANSNSNGNLKFRYKFGKAAFTKNTASTCRLCTAGGGDDDDDDDNVVDIATD